jgi:hypothetical protein
MKEIVYSIVRHDGGWAYRVDETYSEVFATRELARRGARMAAKEQMTPGKAAAISYEGKEGHWHSERSAADARPETGVQDGDS